MRHVCRTILAGLIALAAVIAAYLYIPLWGVKPVFSFQGDLVVVLYLLLIPTLSTVLVRRMITFLPFLNV